MTKIASFDIFDTTLIRKCGRAENVFYILSKELFPDNKMYQAEFYLWRLGVEKNVLMTSGDVNLTLLDIYSQFNDFSEEIIDKETAMNAELNIESQQLICNYEIKRLIAEKRSEGYTICFISDMYISSSFLKKILIREGCANEQDVVFVSCEHKKRKSNGELFLYAKQMYPNVKEWIHFGDNNESDYRMARACGVEAYLVNTGLTKVESLIENKYLSFPFGREISVLVGFQRAARLNLSIKDVDYLNAADFVASTFIPYLIYIYRIASGAGFERLYFISRDSYLLFKMAQSCKLFKNIDCRYIYISRKSLFLPLLNRIDKDRLSLLFGGDLKGKNVVDILEYLKLEELASIIPFKRLDNDEQIDFFVDIIKKQENKILKKQDETRKILDQYFTQEGIYDECPFALIDVGWFGTTRLMVNELRKERGLKNVPFIYYGCRKDVLGRKYGDFYSYTSPDFISHDKTVIVESYYCASNTPSTVGYENVNGRIDPLFAPNQPSAELLSAIHSKVCCEIVKYIEENPFLLSSYALSTWGEYIDLFETHPELIDYSTLSKLKSPGKGNIIEKINLKELFFYILYGKRNYNCLYFNSIYYSYGIKIRQDFIFKNKYKRLKSYLSSHI